MTMSIASPSPIRYEQSHSLVRVGDLLRWGDQHLKNVKLMNREYVTAIRQRSDDDVIFAKWVRTATFMRGEFGMFLGWAAPSKGNGTREPIVYVPRFALYNTWHGWHVDRLYPSWE